MTCCVSWPEVVKGILYQGVVCFVSKGTFVHFSFVLGCMWYFVSLFLVVSNSTIDWLESLFPEMTYYVLSETLKPYSLTHSLLTTYWHQERYLACKSSHSCNP